MLLQETADNLIKMEKYIMDSQIIFPKAADFVKLDVVSSDGKEKFLLDINRKGTLKLTRCTYQKRYMTNIHLVRLDIDTKPHRNPDGTVISPSHIHIYKEGWGIKWAYPLDEFKEITFTNLSNLTHTFLEFCKFCNITKIPSIQEVI